jgi:hypothetical protein
MYAERFFRFYFSSLLIFSKTAAVYDGNLKLILGMIWSIFRCPAITKLNVGGEGEAGDAEAQKGKKTFESQLLAWVQERVANYDLHPSDFKTSFNDGLVFGALIHSIDPTALNYDHFEADKPAENLKIAFDAALKAFQVPILLSVDDMTSDNADERSVVLYTSLLYHAWQAAGAKAADTQIKTKLQKEQESKERLRKELESLRQEVENAKGALNSKHASASGLSEENERLRKLLDYLQRRAKAADSAIVSLENKISTLDQLGGDGSKKLLHSRSANAFLEGSGNSIGGGNSSPSEKSFWDFRVSEDDGGKANILHSSSRQFLSLDGGAPVLGKDKTDSSDWHLVEHKGATALQNLSSNHYLKLNEDGSASMTENIDDALFDITTKSAYDARQKEQRYNVLCSLIFFFISSFCHLVTALRLLLRLPKQGEFPTFAMLILMYIDLDIFKFSLLLNLLPLYPGIYHGQGSIVRFS